jgi:hypothetical protein
MAAGHALSNLRFGYEDFDPARLDGNYDRRCPVRGCEAKPNTAPYGRREMPWCSEHGIRLHTSTFVYWNGSDQRDESRLRNFVVGQDLVRAIALPKGMKAESHRLGYEMSEDALSWNVFVSLAMAGRLREAAEFLTGRSVRVEPKLYLWGRRIDERREESAVYQPLLRAREALESDIHTFVTEPDIMLVADGEMLICIEAKFGSGNTLAHDGPPQTGRKPTSRTDLIARYLGDNTSALTKGIVRRDRIEPGMHSQLFRNIVFASEMAGEVPWHVVNLVSSTQGVGRDDKRKSYADPSQQVRGYLTPEMQKRFTFRTWEGLHAAIIRDDATLTPLDMYLRGKSAHYLRAFNLS